jgi:mono/diheme cytochrome c family protein
MSVALAVMVSGCSGGEDAAPTLDVPALPGSPSVPEEAPPPELDVDMVAVGADLYSRFCASCHGADLKGAADWQVMNADGSFPPPPHDSTGHTWHHGDGLLIDLILEGSEFPQSRMPAFGDELTESDALSILEFFKSTWGPQERAVQWRVTLREPQR